MSQVLFYTGTQAQYDALPTKNNNALYFLTDAGKLYLGSVPYSHPVNVVSSFPESGEKGAVYIHSSTHEAKTWNGDAWVTLALPVATAIGANATDSEIATALAVKSYVDGQIADVSSGVTGAVANVAYDAPSKSISVQKGTGEPVLTALSGLFDGVSYNGATGVLSFTTNGGTAKTVTLPVENFLAAAAFDQTTSVLTLTLTDSSTVTVNLADLVDAYSGGTTDTASVSVGSGVVTAAVKLSSTAGNIIEAKSDGLYAHLEWQSLT